MRPSGTILVIDDDPNDRLLIEEALRTVCANSAVVMFADGGDAIHYLQGDDPYSDRTRFPYPSFVITDLKMPRVDGLAVLEFLRSRPQSAIVPTIVFSSSSDPDDVQKSYMLGASSYHVKPSTAERFTEQVRVMHDYWMTCEVPDVDRNGVRRPTESRGRIGQRYSQDPFGGNKPPSET